MEKTRDLFKKIGDIKGTLHERMGTTKDGNGKDLQKQKRLRRGGKNTQKNYTEQVSMTWITMVMWSFTYSQTI